MKHIIKTVKNHITLLAMAMGMAGALLSGCESFLETEQPIGQIDNALIFEDEALANAAITSMYSKLRDEALVTGGYNGMGYLMGLYADELNYHSLPGLPNENFYLHQVTASNEIVRIVWNNAYSLVYMANSALEGLENAQDLPVDTKAQLKGEALFIRALVHFYLLNIFGDTPYIKGTDASVNQNAMRMEIDMVYDNILDDLQQSWDLLTPSYPGAERTRANRFVVSALRARVYLYTAQWELAENESSFLIDGAGNYTLEENVMDEFLKGSTSAILQLKPPAEGRNTSEGQLLNFSFGPPFNVALNPNLVASMAPDDLRKQYWIKEVSNGTQSWYAATKYKETQKTGISKEYSIVFRIAEQYLIRAEARVNLRDFQGAKEDINVIRERAGLQPTTANSFDDLMETLMKERRFELFTEHGHRWFDLRRTGMAEDILSPIKLNWRPTHILWPLPERELSANRNLTPQNPGY